MSHPPATSPSSPWASVNKVIGCFLAVSAAFFPIAFIYGGIHASYNKRHPVIVEVKEAQAAPPSASLLSPTLAQASSTSPTVSADSSDGDNNAVAAQAAEGQKTYMLVCFACHQPTGLGLPGMFPPLAGSDWAVAPKPDRLIRIVLHGMTGPLNINGKPFTTPAPLMPPQGAALTNKQIADVLTYVRNSWGNKASAVSADYVAAIREAEKARSAMWTEAELLKIADH